MREEDSNIFLQEELRECGSRSKIRPESEKLENMQRNFGEIYLRNCTKTSRRRLSPLVSVLHTHTRERGVSQSWNDSSHEGIVDLLQGIMASASGQVVLTTCLQPGDKKDQCIHVWDPRTGRS